MGQRHEECPEGIKCQWRCEDTLGSPPSDRTGLLSSHEVSRDPEGMFREGHGGHCLQGLWGVNALSGEGRRGSGRLSC